MTAQPDDGRAQSLETCRDVFRFWFGDTYDLDALHITLAAAASHQLLGDPLWVLLLSGPGNAKTETVGALEGAGATITSTVTSEGALLSATARKERTKDATGGLLRKIGDEGVLVIKDFTSIISMNRDLRAQVLAALREVYDGYWERNVGSDGGRTLRWEGRLTTVGAVTSAWDDAHSVIAAMGDRFALLRIDSTEDREDAGLQALGNVGSEDDMRFQLRAAVGVVMANMNMNAALLAPSENQRIMRAASLVTLARTACSYDYQGNVEAAHAPEMPTRFAKQLAQVVRGGVAIGMERSQAMDLALRVARDSLPPLRRQVIEDLAEHPDSSCADVTERLDLPRTTVDRQLQALRMLRVISKRNTQGTGPYAVWRYSLGKQINPAVLASSPDLSQGRHTRTGTSSVPKYSPTDISGEQTCRVCSKPGTIDELSGDGIHIACHTAGRKRP